MKVQSSQLETMQSTDSLLLFILTTFTPIKNQQQYYKIQNRTNPLQILFKGQK